MKDRLICFMLFAHEMRRAFAFAAARAGSRSPAINAIPNRITNNSMSENARAR